MTIASRTFAAEHALSEGGTAVDAAIAAMVSATITEPGIVAPLGGCYLNIWPADGDPVVIDGNVDMLGRGQPTERFGGGLVEAASEYGGGSVGVAAGDGAILAPMPGKVTSVEVAAGEAVSKGQRLLTLEAMKMEHGLVAPFDGVVAELNAVAGAQVQVDAVLVKIEKRDS